MLIIILILIKQILAFQYQQQLTRVLASTLLANTSDYKMAYNEVLHQLIVYGGSSNRPNETNFTKKLTIIYLQQSNRVQNFTMPTLLMNNSYGHVYNNTLLLALNSPNGNRSQLWSFDLIQLEWKSKATINTSLVMSFIHLLQNRLIVTILNDDHTLHFYRYNNDSITKLDMEYEAQCIQTIVQWDNTTVYNAIPIEDYHGNCSNMTVLDYLSISGNLKELNILDSNQTNNSLVVLSSFQMHKVYYHQSTNKIQVQFLSDHQLYLNSKSSHTILHQDILIMASINHNQHFTINLYELPSTLKGSININSPIYYTNIFPNIGSRHFLMDLVQDSFLLVIVYEPIEVYKLYKDVFYNDLSPQGLLQSYFGMNKCLKGWTGHNCTTKACKNSININVVDSFEDFRVDCSGHGKCIQGLCVCDLSWSGEDCSVYQRKKCSKALVDNFPLQNCECMNSTIGGNSCDKIFCPGDCLSHGKCIQGFCKCNQNYFGADCSIMILDL